MPQHPLVLFPLCVLSRKHSPKIWFLTPGSRLRGWLARPAAQTQGSEVVVGCCTDCSLEAFPLRPDSRTVDTTYAIRFTRERKHASSKPSFDSCLLVPAVIPCCPRPLWSPRPLEEGGRTRDPSMPVPLYFGGESRPLASRLGRLLLYVLHCDLTKTVIGRKKVWKEGRACSSVCILGLLPLSL